MSIVIDIYPECPKPEWMASGAWCYCLGEGNDIFFVDQVFDKSATLMTSKKRAHGMESFSKLYRTIEELEQRKRKEK